MRIPDKFDAQGVTPPKVSGAVGKTKAGKTGGVKGNDQVTVSERAKEIARLKAETSKLPDIRTERVTEIKNAVSAGTYNVKGEAVAAKMLKEALIDSTV
jgi:negative regulator of flagellin synthesis FlgM